MFIVSTQTLILNPTTTILTQLTIYSGQYMGCLTYLINITPLKCFKGIRFMILQRTAVMNVTTKILIRIKKGENNLTSVLKDFAIIISFHFF